MESEFVYSDLSLVVHNKSTPSTVIMVICLIMDRASSLGRLFPLDRCLSNNNLFEMDPQNQEHHSRHVIASLKDNMFVVSGFFI